MAIQRVLRKFLGKIQYQPSPRRGSPLACPFDLAQYRVAITGIHSKSPDDRPQCRKGHRVNQSPPLGGWGNRLLIALPHPTMARLQHELFHVSLPQGTVCFDAGDPVDRVYFPTSGLISLLIAAGESELVEAGMIGREGAVGLQSAIGRRTSFARAIVRVQGLFAAIAAEPLRRSIELSAEATSLVTRYTEVLWAEAQQLAACNAVHAALPRLARWLLQSADRLGSDELILTQDLLGEVLTIRRTSVSLLAQELQQRGIIKYRRGRIAITDRSALEGCACECYRVIRNLYRALPVPRDEDAGNAARA
jgi:CRP-like cAMP-binding protein